MKNGKMGEARNTLQKDVTTTQKFGQKPQRHWCRDEYNTEIGCGVVDWIHLAVHCEHGNEISGSMRCRDGLLSSGTLFGGGSLLRGVFAGSQRTAGLQCGLT